MNATRRGTLALLIGGGLWFGGARVAKHLSQSSPNPHYRSIAERLSRLPRNRKLLRGIGLAYLRQLEHRPTAAQVAAALFPSQAELRHALGLKPRRLAELLGQHTLWDYQQGHVVSVEGWLISETEARFAALVALVRRI